MPESKSPQAKNNDAMNAFSRTVAAGLLMLAFMAGGYYLDSWLGTKFFVILGVVVGMTFSITAMLIYSKLSGLEKSVAHVKPLPDEEEKSTEE